MTPKIVTARFLRHFFGGKKWQKKIHTEIKKLVTITLTTTVVTTINKKKQPPLRDCFLYNLHVLIYLTQHDGRAGSIVNFQAGIHLAILSLNVEGKVLLPHRLTPQTTETFFV